MKNSLFSLVVLVCFFALLCFGCEQDKVPISPEQEVTEQEVTNVETEKAICVLLDYGFSREDIEVGDDFLIAEGDIVFSKQSLLEQAKQLKTTTQLKTTAQWKYGIKLTNSVVSNIKVKIHPSLLGYPYTWSDAIECAMAKWRSVGCLLNFYRVSSGQDILICSDQVVDLPQEYRNFEQMYDQNGHYVAGIYARSTYPPDVNTPGYYISVDDDAPCLTNNWWNMIEVAMHELGHAIGLMHPYEGTHIDGTPYYDYSSVMNQVVNARVLLSDGDKLAVRELYPKP